MVIRWRRRDLGGVTAHGVAMLRQQFDQWLVDVCDQTVGDRDADQNGDHTLRHREHVPVVVLGEAVPVVGDLGLAVDTDQHGPNVVQRGRAGGDRLLDLCLQRHVVDRRLAGHGRERRRGEPEQPVTVIRTKTATTNQRALPTFRRIFAHRSPTDVAPYSERNDARSTPIYYVEVGQDNIAAC